MALMADNLRSGHPEQQSTVGQAKGLSGLNNLMADNLQSGHPEQQSTVGTNKGINIQMAENLKNGDIGLSEGAKRAAEINAQSGNAPQGTNNNHSSGLNKEDDFNSDGLSPARVVTYDDEDSENKKSDFNKKQLDTDSARREHILLRKIKSSSDDNIITINFSSAEELIEELEKLKNTQVKNARNSLIECVNLLNFTLKGQVSSLPVGIVDTGIEEIEKSIDGVISKIKSTINSTSDYSNSAGINDNSDNISGTAAAGVGGGALADASSTINDSEEENISGTAVDGVTIDNDSNNSSSETYIDENGNEVGKDDAYTDEEDISGTATDGVNVDDDSSEVTDGENVDDSSEVSDEDISGEATDGVPSENSSTEPADAKKSWATYDPENGYNSLELEQKREAYKKAKKELEDEIDRLKKSGVTNIKQEDITNENPSTNLNDKQTIVTPPSNTSNQTPTEHVGGATTPTTPPNEAASDTGSYAITGGYTRGNSNVSSTPAPTATPTPEPVQEPVVEEPKPEVEKPIEEVVPKESKVTKIPTITPPNNTKETSSNSGGGSRIIPIAAGLGAAAAAGLGAKAYLDRKENTDNGEDDEWDTEVDEGNKPIDINYDNKSEEGESVLEDDDEYTTSDDEEIVERYDARANEELADLQ